MTTPPSPAAALSPVVPVFTNTERLALAGFLAGYSGASERTYAGSSSPRPSSLSCRQRWHSSPTEPRSGQQSSHAFGMNPTRQSGFNSGARSPAGPCGSSGPPSH